MAPKKGGSKAVPKKKGKGEGKAWTHRDPVPKELGMEIKDAEVHGPTSAEQEDVMLLSPKEGKDAGSVLKKQVSRYYRTKLKKYQKHELKILIGKSSKLTVDKYIERGLRELPASAKKLSSQFWTDFFKEFGLTSQRFSGIFDIASDPEQVRDEVSDPLLELRRESPTQRKIEPVSEFLQYNRGDVNQSELVLLISSCLEGDRVSKTFSDQCLVLLLKYIGRWSLQKKFPEVWQAIEDDADQFLLTLWKENDPKKTSRDTWVINHRYALAPFMDVADARALAAMSSDDQKRFALLEKLYTTAIGAALYKVEAHEVQFSEYLTTAKERIYELEMDEITDNSVDGFKASMLTMSKALVANGHAKWMKKKIIPVSFLAELAPIEFGSINDYWNFPWEGRVRTLGVQNGVLKRLPWEEVAFGADSVIAGIPQAARMQPSTVEESANSRRAVFEVFDKYTASLTFEEMRQIFRTQCAEVATHDKYFKIEETFLFKCVQPMVEKSVREEVLGNFPSGEQDVQDSFYQTFLQQLTEIQGSRRVAACSDDTTADLASELQAIHELVSKLRKGIPPTDERRKTMTPFFQQVLKACEGFCTIAVIVKVSSSALPVKKVLCGKEALNQYFQIMDAAPLDQQPKKTEMLSRFRFLLNEKQKQVLDDILKRFLSDRRVRHLDLKAIEDDGSSQPSKKAKFEKVSGKEPKKLLWAAPACDAQGSSSSSSSGSKPPEKDSKAVQKKALLSLLNVQRKAGTS